jgi:hypothetical protein
MTIIHPTYIQGPAVVEYDGAFHFSNGGIPVSYDTSTNNTPSDVVGELGETLKSRVTKVSVPLVGERKNFTKVFPYTGAHLGKRIFNPGGAANKPLKIHTLEDQQTITFARAALTKAAGMSLGPNKTMWSSNVEWSVLSDATKAPTAADALLTIAAWANGFVFPTEDDSLITKDIFHAALGAMEAPFNAMSALAGFDVDINYAFDELPADEVGIADMVLKSIIPTVKFIPANLTQAQAESLLRLQGAGALLPGQFIGVKGQSLVIASDNLSVTLANMGAKSYAESYKPGEHRLKELTFSSKITYSNSTLDSIFTITDLAD